MTSAPWCPTLPPGALLRHDPVRGAHVLLLPERVVVLHGSARAVLELCDGHRTGDDIATLLVEQHPAQAEREGIALFLDRLRTQGCLR
ncbi:pyrroloquinoline quinone biosynthesis peptide chaperone PqqD [Streptomyces sp. Q6]|uniref:Pyrroloquinoline quinone biosynthesis peptide chaperone PqqD n=1 Tax=Streptomyces citrinus TaxID=3118173 RepID=A0ACD5AN53_9ACTN